MAIVDREGLPLSVSAHAATRPKPDCERCESRRCVGARPPRYVKPPDPRRRALTNQGPRTCCGR
jgi:hypothetical protein